MNKVDHAHTGKRKESPEIQTGSKTAGQSKVTSQKGMSRRKNEAYLTTEQANGPWAEVAFSAEEIMPKDAPGRCTSHMNPPPEKVIFFLQIKYCSTDIYNQRNKRQINVNNYFPISSYVPSCSSNSRSNATKINKYCEFLPNIFIEFFIRSRCELE